MVVLAGNRIWNCNLYFYLSVHLILCFEKMVPRDLTIYIYHISTVYVKLYQIRISFVTLNPDVFLTCGMPKWRRKFMFGVLSGLTLN